MLRKTVNRITHWNTNSSQINFMKHSDKDFKEAMFRQLKETNEVTTSI